MNPERPGVAPVRAVVDTSSLVPARLRRDLQQAAELGAVTAIWSPWIIAELNRVLSMALDQQPAVGYCCRRSLAKRPASV